MITLIAAHDRNMAIGRGNALPWSVPEDLRFFREKTLGKIVVMGRKTWDSLPSGGLPGRTNVVVSRTERGVRDGVIFTSVEGATDLISGAPPGAGFCIGGGELYRAMMPLSRKMILTSIDTEVEGADAWFPEFDRSLWAVTSERVIRESGPRCVARTYAKASPAV